jgi:hypothetical protein
VAQRGKIKGDPFMTANRNAFLSKGRRMSELIGFRLIMAQVTGRPWPGPQLPLAAPFAPMCARLGTIDGGGSGRSLMKTILKNTKPEFAAVYNVYETSHNKQVAETGKGVKGNGDFRKFPEDKTLAAVLIATPDHRRHDMFVKSLKAGKDARLEKPMYLSVEEGARMVKAARATDRMVHAGHAMPQRPLHRRRSRKPALPQQTEFLPVFYCVRGKKLQSPARKRLGGMLKTASASV